MSDLVRSLVRSLVPIGIGAVTAFLSRYHVSAQEQAYVFAGVTVVYSTGVRLLESKWPSFGILLGSLGAPNYPQVQIIPKPPAQPPTPTKIADLVPGEPK